MTAESLRAAREALPFRPFSLRLADGRSVHVPRPEALAAPGPCRTAVVVGEDDGFEAIDLDRVVTLSFEPTTSPAAESR